MTEFRTQFQKEINAFMTKFSRENNESIDDAFWLRVNNAVVSWSNKYKDTEHETYTTPVIIGLFKAVESDCSEE